MSWQVVPRRLNELPSSTDAATVKRVMEAMFQMKKLDIAGLERAASA
ncbi:MAG TPA: hypothetical protein VFL87_01320 [Thermoleophilaceae bacterium]|nr:hypothetical protein [Thermoleophilaceae bacterium]